MKPGHIFKGWLNLCRICFNWNSPTSKWDDFLTTQRLFKDDFIDEGVGIYSQWIHSLPFVFKDFWGRTKKPSDHWDLAAHRSRILGVTTFMGNDCRSTNHNPITYVQLKFVGKLLCKAARNQQLPHLQLPAGGVFSQSFGDQWGSMSYFSPASLFHITKKLQSFLRHPFFEGDVFRHFY